MPHCMARSLLLKKKLASARPLWQFLYGSWQAYDPSVESNHAEQQHPLRCPDLSRTLKTHCPPLIATCSGGDVV
jgi:hypothetical protein